jgi:hypothetical protein
VVHDGLNGPSAGPARALAAGLGETRWVRWVALGAIALRALLGAPRGPNGPSSFDSLAAEELVAVLRAELALLARRLREDGVPRDLAALRLFRPPLLLPGAAFAAAGRQQVPRPPARRCPAPRRRCWRWRWY